ncbi:hypothetical protein ACJX0J_018744 [Zea mays]
MHGVNVLLININSYTIITCLLQAFYFLLELYAKLIIIVTTALFTAIMHLLQQKSILYRYTIIFCFKRLTWKHYIFFINYFFIIIQLVRLKTKCTTYIKYKLSFTLINGILILQYSIERD